MPGPGPAESSETTCPSADDSTPIPGIGWRLATLNHRRSIAGRPANAGHVEWTEERLQQGIRGLEAALRHQRTARAPARRWKRTLILKSLEHHRRLLATLRRGRG